jgi:hypothetical protein
VLGCDSTHSPPFFPNIVSHIISKYIPVSSVCKMSKPDITKEVARLARLSNVQNGLPPSMRALPVAAIVAGGVITKLTGMSNGIEERLLGPSDTIALDKPVQIDPKSSSRPHAGASAGEMQHRPNEGSNKTSS